MTQILMSAGNFGLLLKGLSPFVDFEGVTFKAENKKYVLIGMDRSNVMFFNVEIDFGIFSKIDDAKSFCVDMKDWGKVRKYASNLLSEEGDVDIKIGEDNLVKIKIKTKNFKRSYEFPQVEDYGAEKKVPVLNFDNNMEINIKDFYREVESMIGVKIGISFKKSGVLLYSENDLMRKSKSEINQLFAKIKFEKETTARFQTDYLLKMVKMLMELDDLVTINCGDSYPCEMKAKTDYIKMSIILAPCVSND